MFERVIYNVLTDGIALATANPLYLRRLLSSPGWDVGEDGGNDEIQKIVDFWNGDGTPKVLVNYPRAASDIPCFAITLGGENESDEYLGHDAGLIEEAQEIIEAVEEELGRPVEAKVRRQSLRYAVYVYTEHPDVTLAYYNLATKILRRGEKTFEAACFEDPKYSGNDLMPSANHLPTSAYVRQITIEGSVHVLYTDDLDLGPLGIGRGKRISGVHIDDRSTGVVAKVTVFREDEE